MFGARSSNGVQHPLTREGLQQELETFGESLTSRFRADSLHIAVKELSSCIQELRSDLQDVQGPKGASPGAECDARRGSELAFGHARRSLANGAKANASNLRKGLKRFQDHEGRKISPQDERIGYLRRVSNLQEGPRDEIVGEGFRQSQQVFPQAEESMAVEAWSSTALGSGDFRPRDMRDLGMQRSSIEDMANADAAWHRRQMEETEKTEYREFRESSEKSSLLQPEEKEELALADLEDLNEMEKFVRGNYFNYGSCLVVVLNSLVIGLQTDYKIQHLEDPMPGVFDLIDKLFCVVFTIELSLRMYTYGSRFLVMSGCVWNIFDCIVVGMQLLDIAIKVCADSDKPAVPQLSGDQREKVRDVSFLRLLRILRLVRIIRLMRVLRLVEELRTIASSIAGSMKSLFWTLALLMLLMYGCGVCITQVVADHLASHAEGNKTKELLYYYGSLGRTILSLYEGITGGQSWDCMLEPLIEDISQLTVPFFCSYVAFCVFALMNSVTGVFCEKAMQNVRADQEEFLANHIREAFEKNVFMKHRDKSQRFITFREFQSQLHTEEIMDYFKAINVDVSEAEALFALLDAEQTGTVDFENFMNSILRLQGPAKSIDLTILMHETDKMHRSMIEHMTSTEARLASFRSALEPISKSGPSGIRVSANPCPSKATTCADRPAGFFDKDMGVAPIFEEDSNSKPFPQREPVS